MSELSLLWLPWDSFLPAAGLRISYAISGCMMHTPRLEPECRSSTSPIKLIDFSLACFFFEPTEPGGTPEFMAPELVADPDGMAATGWGPEIDMWAVGILVFWMLCGRTPFDDDNVPQILQNIMQVQNTVSLNTRARRLQ